MKTLIGWVVLVMLLAPFSAWGKVGGGDILFRLTGAANVVFSHETHVGQGGVKCRECHYRIYTTVEGHKKATMADMEKGESCGTCHNGKRAFDVKKDCVKCHKAEK